MRFGHIADVHIGSWRDPKLKNLGLKAFEKAIDKTIEKKLDFLLISGDLFNTSLPQIDHLKNVVTKLNQLKINNIPVYIIAGSHDFSPSGKTMLDVLEEAGLFINVMKGSVIDKRLMLDFTIDPSTGAKITGILGKKGMLDRQYYEMLVKESLEEEEGFKIFMFHTALTEFKPQEMEKMDSSPLSLLPKNFNYYAGGHVHYVFEKNENNYGLITFPGALFPANFSELEKYGEGGMYIYEDGNLNWEPIELMKNFSLKMNCDNLSPLEVENKVIEQIKDKDFNNTMITIRLFGLLRTGKPTDVDFKRIFDTCYSKNAYFVMKNTSKLVSKAFEEIKEGIDNVEQVETDLIKKHLGQIKVDGLDIEKEEALTKQLINILAYEKDEGEKVMDFEKRLKEEVEKVLNNEQIISLN